MGRDVVFSSGQYSPGSVAGQRLLAHELTHVVQQNDHSSVQPRDISELSHPLEAQAELTAEAILSDRCMPVICTSPARIQRQSAGSVPPLPATGAPGGAAAKGGATHGGPLCAGHPNETYYQNDPSFCKDTPETGRLHKGYRCYREIPTGSGCPPGKHVCFRANTGVCDGSESHIDSTGPSVKRSSNGTCDLSYLGGCSILHFFLDVPAGRTILGGAAGATFGALMSLIPGLGLGLGLGALVGGGFGSLAGFLSTRQ